MPDRDDWYVQMILEDPKWKPYWDHDTEILREWMKRGLIYELEPRHFDEEVRTRGMQWVRCSDPDQEAPMREKWMAISGAARSRGREAAAGPTRIHRSIRMVTIRRGLALAG